MQQPITVETALILKKIWAQRRRMTALPFWRQHGGMKKKTLKENNEPFGFMAVYCLVLASLEFLVIFSSAAKYFLKCN